MKEIQKVQGGIMKREDKLNMLLDLIDTIEITEGSVLIKTSKNIAILNDGNTVHINTGKHIMLSETIHLNPNIELSKYDLFSEKLLDEKIDKAEEMAIYYDLHPEEKPECIGHKEKIKELT